MMGPDVEAGADDAACAASVAANSFANGAFFTLNCPRHEIVFTNEQVKTGYAKAKIERRIKKCWKNMGSGENNQFQKNWVLAGSNPCLICSEIEFEGDVVDPKISDIFDIDGNAAVLKFTSAGWEPTDMLTSRKYYSVYMVYRSAWINIPYFTSDDKPKIVTVDGDDYSKIKCDLLYN